MENKTAAQEIGTHMDRDTEATAGEGRTERNMTVPNPMNHSEMNGALQSILDIGELLLESGAEVHRVEDTIKRLCKAYGFGRTDVFSITSSIVVTALAGDGQTVTQTRRIYDVNTDLALIEKLNGFSRELCRSPLPTAEIEKRLAEYRNSAHQNSILRCAAYAGISAVFAAFFGGNAMDSLAAALAGIVLFGTVEFSGRLRLNSIFQLMGCSAVTAVAVMLLYKAGIGVHPERVMMGNIMLVIPGVQFTTALRDMMNGDNVNGTLNLCEALMKAVAVAIGFVFVRTHMGM